MYRHIKCFVKGILGIPLMLFIVFPMFIGLMILDLLSVFSGCGVVDEMVFSDKSLVSKLIYWWQKL